MNIIISTNVDNNYWNVRHHGFIDSVVKHARKEDKIVLMIINDGTGFRSTDLDDRLEMLAIDINSINYSKHTNLKNRPNFVCLESGEFVEFANFDNDDVLIMCDWDVVMQRGFTEKELNIINNLGALEFGMNKDHYPKNLLYGYLGMEKIFDDISKSWIVYNTGIQVARISAWKELYRYWKELAPMTYAGCNHHAAGQALFNYIVQKFNMIKELPLTFHNADWFTATPAKIIDNVLYVDNEKVLFNHHKWRYLPSF